MNNLEQATFHRIFESITRFQDVDAALRELLACLIDCTGCDAGVLVRVDTRAPGKHAFHVACSHARDGHSGTEFQSRFENHFFKGSLAQKVMSAKRPSLLLSSVLGEGAWRTADVKLTIFQPHGAADAVVLLLRNEERCVRWMACLALKRRSDLRKEPLRMIESAAPQLCSGLENLTSWNERWKRAQAIEALLGYTNDLLVCISHSPHSEPRVIAATKAAQNALGLRVDTAAGNERLREFLDLALSIKQTTQAGPRWLAPTGQLYRISRETPADARGGNLCLVRLQAATESAKEPTQADDLRAAHQSGLSQRESAVFAHMARGLGNREIAEALNISIDTVRAHLRNVFAKLNVSSRVEAINAVRRTHEQAQTFFVSAKTPIDMSAALNNDTTRSSKRAQGLNGTTETTPHAIGITAQAT